LHIPNINVYEDRALYRATNILVANCLTNL